MKSPHSFDELFAQIQARRTPFLVAFFVIVSVSYGFLYVIDFVPEPPAETVTDQKEEEKKSSSFSREKTDQRATAVVEPIEPLSPYPTSIIFESLDERRVPVLNPESREIEALDTALLEGAVRHPDSADFTNEGNIFILGHSSYLPNVLNRNFQAFNGIQNLTWGDRIRVESEDRVYIYRVDQVYEASAAEVIVPHTPGEARLTLATCDSFGSVDDRFIVEAVLIGQSSL